MFNYMGNEESDGLYFKESGSRLHTEHVLNRVKFMPNYVVHAGGKLSNSLVAWHVFKNKVRSFEQNQMFFAQKVKIFLMN